MISDITAAKLDSQHAGIKPLIDAVVEKCFACCLELVASVFMFHFSGAGSTCGSTWKFESGSENCAKSAPVWCCERGRACGVSEMKSAALPCQVGVISGSVGSPSSGHLLGAEGVAGQSTAVMMLQ